MRRSPKHNRVRPRQLATPFLSSPTSSPTIGAQMSDDEHLDGSFLLISGEEDEESSTVGSSLRDSVIGDQSSDSSEDDEPAGREGWDEGTDGGEPIQPGASSVAASSFVDAEATASDVSASKDTLKDSTNSSQVCLIMPALEGSGLTSSATVPREPLTELLNIPNVVRTAPPRAQRVRASSPSGRGVEASWLEASSRLWNMSPEMELMLGGAAEYKVLANTSDILDIKEGKVGEREAEIETLRNTALAEDASGKGQKVRQQLRRVLVSADLIAHGAQTKKWSVLFALASVLSVALFRSFGTTKVIPAPALPSTEDTASSIFHRLPTAHVTISSSASESSSIAPMSTQLVPDLKLIKQALSTFSNNAPRLQAGSPLTSDRGSMKGVANSMPHHSRERRVAMTSTSCCALSIRESKVALTTATIAIPTMDTSWSKTLRHKIMRVPPPTPIVNATVPLSPCHCSLSQHVRSEVLAHFGLAFGTTTRYALSAKRYMDHIYAPVLAELQKDMIELLALAAALAETTSTLSRIVVHRAARGLTVSRRALDSATGKLSRYLPTPSDTGNTTISTEAQPVLREAIALAKSNIDSLAHYMDDQTTALSDYIEENVIIMEQRGLKSLKQAKRGLDKLISEAKKMGLDVDTSKAARTDVGKDGPMPFKQMHKRGSRSPTPRKSRLHRHAHQVKRNDHRGKRTIPPAETPSRGRKMLDMLHHGAVALVL